MLFAIVGLVIRKPVDICEMRKPDRAYVQSPKVIYYLVFEINIFSMESTHALTGLCMHSLVGHTQLAYSLRLVSHEAVQTIDILFSYDQRHTSTAERLMLIFVLKKGAELESVITDTVL